MQYIEEVHWILDKPGATIHTQDEKIRENITFVQSLGKKCDSIGWSTLKREDPQADEILEKIAAFCRKKGWSARGSYIRAYADFDTDWYQLDGAYFKDNTFGEYRTVPAQDGGAIKVCSIKAFRELTAAPKRWGMSLFVPEGFWGAYRAHGMTGLDFCWAKDTGKYTAQQYFEVFGTVRIPRVATAWDLKNQNLRKLGPGGGWLPRLGEIFQTWTLLDLPYCYKKEDMPAGGIAYAYIPRTFSCSGLYQILVHKDTAQQLLQAKAIPAGALKPVPVLEDIPSGYTMHATSDLPRPVSAYMEQSLLDCEALQKKTRPLWQITEKDAIKIMRKAKTDRKEDFGKKLSNANAEALAATKQEPMLPYYLLANGGYLSDEYKLLSADESIAETQKFYQSPERETLPDGIVIGTCANGDWVLLLQDGAVIRFSHEAPETAEQWMSIPQFIAEAIGD